MTKPVKFSVGVDTGTIQIASSEKNLEKAGDFYHKIQDLTGWSADSVWDGKKGAINTKHGDGLYDVIYDPQAVRDWKETRDLESAVLVNLSPKYDPKAPGFTLYVGDVGVPQGAIEIPPHHYLAGFWLDDYTLQIFAE